MKKYVLKCMVCREKATHKVRIENLPTVFNLTLCPECSQATGEFIIHQLRVEHNKNK